ncbi:hypothetical protein ACE3MS_15450 [Paenibacillus dendritiformis]|uniref:hypothetical protein n=1 Tax=Paenibacillus dendritiformis TaxID=130049 RepID=UPI00365EA773
MAGRKPRSKEPNVEEIGEKDGVIYFHAKRVMTTSEHEQLSEKIRYEMRETGLKIVLVPFSVNAAVE